jgi:hypothetical protein
VKATEPASTLGLRSAPADGLRLAAIVLLDRQPDVDRAFVESVPIVEALPALVPQTSHLSALELPLRMLLETLISTGGVRRVVYSEASSLPPLIDDVLRSIDDDLPFLTDVAKLAQRDCDCFSGLVTDASPTTDRIDRPGALWRTTYADALFVDDSLLVLVGERLVVLEGIGPILWLAADGLTEVELREIVMRQLPEPPAGVDTVAVIADAVKSLVGEGLLARS